MKGIISGIKRMEIHDGDGIRTTLFFKGCPLKCIWCHNPESISVFSQAAFFQEKCIGCGMCGIDDKCKATKEMCDKCPTEALKFYGEEWEAKALAENILADAPFFQNSGGGVTLSGGECLLQADFAVELATILHANGISVNIDTCGYVSQTVLKWILPYVDTFLYDVKAIDPEVHKRLTERDNERILDNLRYLSEMGASIEVRIPFVVGCNDTEIWKIGEFLRELRGIKKVKVLRYHHFAASRYEALGMVNTLPAQRTEMKDVENAVQVLREFGLPAVSS